MHRSTLEYLMRTSVVQCVSLAVYFVPIEMAYSSFMHRSRPASTLSIKGRTFALAWKSRWQLHLSDEMNCSYIRAAVFVIIIKRVIRKIKTKKHTK